MVTSNVFSSFISFSATEKTVKQIIIYRVYRVRGSVFSRIIWSKYRILYTVCLDQCCRISDSDWSEGVEISFYNNTVLTGVLAVMYACLMDFP